MTRNHQEQIEHLESRLRELELELLGKQDLRKMKLDLDEKVRACLNDQEKGSKETLGHQIGRFKGNPNERLPANMAEERHDLDKGQGLIVQLEDEVQGAEAQESLGQITGDGQAKTEHLMKSCTAEPFAKMRSFKEERDLCDNEISSLKEAVAGKWKEQRGTAKEQEVEIKTEEELKKIFQKLVKDGMTKPVRGGHEQELIEAETDLSQKVKDVEEEVHATKESNKLEKVTDKDRNQEPKEDIHSNAWDLDAHLVTWIETISEKENRLREVLDAKQGLYAGKIRQLEVELVEARQRAESEQQAYDEAKEDTERQLQEKKDYFEAQAQSAASYRGDLNRQIMDLKRSLQAREEGVRFRTENVDKRIKDEVDTLESMKSEIEQHAELKQQLGRDNEMCAPQLKVLQQKQKSKVWEQENEIGTLYAHLDIMTVQFKEERQQLQQTLKEILDANNDLREQHERDILQLNMRLGHTFQAIGGKDVTKDLEEKVDRLQRQLSEKSQMFEQLHVQYEEERKQLKEKNDGELRALKKQLSRQGTTIKKISLAAGAAVTSQLPPNVVAGRSYENLMDHVQEKKNIR